MSTKHNQKTSLLRFWTTRYLVILCCGLAIIGLVSTYWIQYSETEKRLELMKLMAEEMADRVVYQNGSLQVSRSLPQIIDRRQVFLQLDRKLLLFILDDQKRIIFRLRGPIANNPVSISFPLDDQKAVEKVTVDSGEKFYLVKRKLEHNQQTVGWIIILHPETKRAPWGLKELQLLIIMLGSLAVLGWIVIYLLTRKLSKPIKNVADAAKEIVSGNYEIHLDKDIKEKEIYELVESFKDMVGRLRQLELMRTELLAGVTHELKTPVTSISGLVQAVKDKVVTGTESKEFLEICIKETNRLQKMVEDLLDFNSFVVGEINVHKEVQNINQLIAEITHQWKIVNEVDSLQVLTKLPTQTIFASTDAMRVQQILYNLLHNSKQAIDHRGKIEVVLSKQGNEIWIDVSDSGSGIREEEQALIFERFFRGQDKKHKSRGLGLGLPFSKMLAKALGGDLLLIESRKGFTHFRIILTN